MQRALHFVSAIAMAEKSTRENYMYYRCSPHFCRDKMLKYLCLGTKHCYHCHRVTVTWKPTETWVWCKTKFTKYLKQPLVHGWKIDYIQHSLILQASLGSGMHWTNSPVAKVQLQALHKMKWKKKRKKKERNSVGGSRKKKKRNHEQFSHCYWAGYISIAKTIDKLMCNIVIL